MSPSTAVVREPGRSQEGGDAREDPAGRLTCTEPSARPAVGQGGTGRRTPGDGSAVGAGELRIAARSRRSTGQRSAVRINDRSPPCAGPTPARPAGVAERYCGNAVPTRGVEVTIRLADLHDPAGSARPGGAPRARAPHSPRGTGTSCSADRFFPVP